MICSPLNTRLLQTSIISFLVITYITEISATEILKWTNLNCQVLEGGRNYMDFEYCYLKAVRRDYTELFMRVQFFQLPLTNVGAKMQLWKRANGYKPFLYKIKFDLCKLFNKDNYHMSWEKFLFDIVEKDVKEKFACPWNLSAAGVDHFGLQAEIFRLPLPTGTYRIDAIFDTYGIPRIMINITISKQE